MPRATIDITATERFELKSLPEANGEEAGFVELRKLSYGQILARRDMATSMSIGGIDSRGKDEDIKAAIDIIQKAVTEFEFKNCIAKHNLEDASGILLNFSNPKSVAELDPKVGQEIGTLIDDINQWDIDVLGKDVAISEPESELV